MIEIRTRTDEPAAVDGQGVLALTLVFQDRQRSRLRVTLSNGQEAALLMPRGTVLRGGQRLKLSDGRVVEVRAAPERVSTVRPFLAAPEGALPPAHGEGERVLSLARAAYHLGNRHVPLELGLGYLRYLHDHVLDAMVSELGLVVSQEEAPFEPEGGAYGKHTHAEGHGHAHGHAHTHDDHDHQHGQAQRSVRAVTRALGLVDLTVASDDDAGGR